jgi:DNA-binding CsgD family transcriptional regulator
MNDCRVQGQSIHGASPSRFEQVLPGSTPPLHPSEDGNPHPRVGTQQTTELPASDDGATTERVRSAALFLGIVLLVAVDLFEDWRWGSKGLHLGLEAVALALASLGLWLLQVRMRREQASARALRARLDEARAAAETWRRETEALATGLGRAIDSQFQLWKLTTAEREVSLLLLKGLSLREIAGVRETSERTVRQQALDVYRKAGLAGRAELSAYFLEDLLAPVHPGPAHEGE